MSAVRRSPATRLIVACGALLAIAFFSARPAQAQLATARANMSFSPATISAGGTTTLNFTIQITPAGGGADTIAESPSFTDTLPSGLVVATPNGLSIPDNTRSGCNGASVRATAGSGTITFSVSSMSATGRVATGGKVIYPWTLGDGARLAPYAGLYADWRFGTDDAVPVGEPIVGIGNGWSARVTGGVAYTTAGGASLGLGGEYGGLGADYKVWTANARGGLPF